ncbi:TauD/TfdA family dioxygenase [Glycomyces sp. TRM65418]|uniref:TauD/TfdA family dioxygenase n=1 Tax=Glycomyces sp. TRM65418 TaxID=2867006 RepID=UPI001CE693F5|nr:TauD/TfdA family dioxygenase [Glycomyces sp. TRM65418]MCC3762595.1 TauD/TfdA family dioxygenase [Glycomyces sp. TRM65418]QZD56634.1 TauD/TfdA family dioxygenase [Glycomyces sp. TRM65418]
MLDFDFEVFRVDPWDPSAVTTALRTHGIATVEGIVDRDDLTTAAAAHMRTRTHRDAELDSITDIRPDTRLQAQAAGIGFSREGVAPHTEGTSLPRPPQLLFLVCARPAPRGGETILVNGDAVRRDLATTDPGALAVLSRPEAVGFGIAGQRAPVFEETTPGSITLRYRDDDLVHLEPADRWAWERLRAAVARRQQRYMLRQGQGVLVDNMRWLHGRTGFNGERLMYRLIGDRLDPPESALQAIHTARQSVKRA